MHGRRERACGGYFVEDSVRTATDAAMMTRRIFRFNRSVLPVSHGLKLADPGVTVTRAGVGATGFEQEPRE